MLVKDLETFSRIISHNLDAEKLMLAHISREKLMLTRTRSR
jgi:hypothetical protein